MLLEFLPVLHAQRLTFDTPAGVGMIVGGEHAGSVASIGILKTFYPALGVDGEGHRLRFRLWLVRKQGNQRNRDLT